MVLGGIGTNPDEQTDAAEVISLEPDKNPVPDCLANVASPFPITISDMAGGLTWPGRSKSSGLMDELDTFVEHNFKHPITYFIFYTRRATTYLWWTTRS